MPKTGISFNRTSLELKLSLAMPSPATHQTFNRTSLELKRRLIGGAFENATASFNRTSLELKRVSNFTIYANSAGLLIAPVWN